MLRELIPKVSHARLMVSLVAKMMNKLLSERDWPVMEVAHHLLDLPFVECSYIFICVDCCYSDCVWQMTVIEGEEVREYQLLY